VVEASYDEQKRVPLLTLRTIEYNESMRRILFFPIFTLFLILFTPLGHVRADWYCDQPGTIDSKCIEYDSAVPPPPPNTFKTLRECLTYTTPQDTTDDLCKKDPRYIMRNFAALNFWSVGRGLSLAVPLAIAFGAGVCLLFLLYGAYTYIMSGGDEKKITDSMHTMTYSALGLIVIVISYAIVRTILFITKINTFGF